MSLKGISYLELWQPLCSVEWNHLCNFGRRYHKDQFCEIIFEFEPVVKEEMSLKDISYLELWQPLYSVEQIHLCNFGRRHHEEQFCEIILNLDQWFRRCHLKIFLIWRSCSPFVQQNGTISAIWYEEQICEIILSLDQWLRKRCLLKILHI